MSTEQKNVSRKWVGLAEAARLIGQSNAAVYKAAVAKDVRVQLLPGKTPRYCKEDLVRLRAEREPAGA
jgi:hypothetical protein